jgi:hypothetical protein
MPGFQRLQNIFSKKKGEDSFELTLPIQIDMIKSLLTICGNTAAIFYFNVDPRLKKIIMRI